MLPKPRLRTYCQVPMQDSTHDVSTARSASLQRIAVQLACFEQVLVVARTAHLRPYTPPGRATKAGPAAL